MIKQGFVSGMSNEVYHSIDALSHSFMVTLLEWSPLHAITPRKETQALIDGQHFHTWGLEPERAEKEYIIYPDDCLVGSGKGQRERKAEFDAEAGAKGLTIVKPDELQKFKCMAGAIHAHPEACKLLSNGEPELSGFWEDPETGIWCKLRMDWINKPNHYLVDLKKTTDARPHSFTRDAYKWGYDMEAFWYLYGTSIITGVEHRDFYFVACEDREPWGVNVYKASEEFITEGGRRCSQARGIYLECKEKDEWPCYPNEIIDLELPGWVKRKEQYNIFE